MLPPTHVLVPVGTKSFYITAISLYPTIFTVFISWNSGSATFGTTFIGPDPNYILGDNIFGAPVIVQDGFDTDKNPAPIQLSISFDFQDTMATQHSVSEPVTASCGPAGSAEKVMISAYAASNEKKSAPMTVTVMFKKEMKGLLR
jgi:hypothetical protein